VAIASRSPPTPDDTAEYLRQRLTERDVVGRSRDRCPAATVPVRPNSTKLPNDLVDWSDDWRSPTCLDKPIRRIANAAGRGARLGGSQHRGHATRKGDLAGRFPGALAAGW
jgi:hypothetical protein